MLYSTRPAWVALALGAGVPLLLFVGTVARVWEGASVMYGVAASPWGYAVVPSLLVLSGLVMWLCATDTWRNIPGLARLWLRDVRAEAVDRGVTTEHFVQWVEWRSWLRVLMRTAHVASRGELTEKQLAHFVADTWWLEKESGGGGRQSVKGVESEYAGAGDHRVDYLECRAFRDRLARCYKETRPWLVAYPLSGVQR